VLASRPDLGHNKMPICIQDVASAVLLISS
jgi:hypothetical protein